MNQRGVRPHRPLAPRSTGPQSSWIIERAGAGGGPYVRTLLLKDTSVGDDIADHVPIWQAGTGVRVIGVLHYAITSDLVVRVKMNGMALITLTIPAATVVDTPVVATTFTPPGFADLAILSWDVLASDGSADRGGICSITVEWQ